MLLAYRLVLIAASSCNIHDIIFFETLRKPFFTIVYNISFVQGIVYSFNAGVSSEVQKVASHLGVPVREYNVIYRLIDDIKSELDLNMPTVEEECQVGKGSVIQEFLITESKKKIPVAGCKVISGKFDRNSLVKVVRGEKELIRDCKLSSLKHKKDEVGSIAPGQECGVRLESDSVRFEANDDIIFYEMKKAVRNIEWDPGF